MFAALKTILFPFHVAYTAGSMVWGGAKWAASKLNRRAPPYGNAKFAALKDLKSNRSGGFVLGKLNGKAIFTKYEHGCLMFGRAGSGKSATTIERVFSHLKLHDELERQKTAALRYGEGVRNMRNGIDLNYGNRQRKFYKALLQQKGL